MNHAYTDLSPDIYNGCDCKSMLGIQLDQFTKKGTLVTEIHDRHYVRLQDIIQDIEFAASGIEFKHHAND